MNEERYTVKNIYSKLYKNTNNNSGDAITVSVPGSKSITNRALLLAVLAKGKTVLNGVLFSDDSRHFMECVKDLGFDINIDEQQRKVEVTGLGGLIPKSKADIYVGSAGTAARFLTALLGISKGEYHLDASAQMRRRPMAPLLETLKNAGADISFDENEGFFPFTISNAGCNNTHFKVNIDTSSQFLSALLICAPVIGKDVVIDVYGSHGMAYIDMTVSMMKQFGVDVIRDDNYTNDDCVTFIIKGGQCYKALDYIIEPDVSGAAYFYALAAVLGKKVIVENVHSGCMQGDIRFVELLGQMGCKVSDTPSGIEVTGPEEGRLKGITANMHTCSDQAITMAAIAPYADSPVKITGISHIKFQESNRIQAIVNESTRMGLKCDSDDDSVTIYPGQPKPAVIETYDDHRMAMGFSITGLRADGIVIDNPGCCSKTFENYFEVLDEVITKLQ